MGSKVAQMIRDVTSQREGPSFKPQIGSSCRIILCGVCLLYMCGVGFLRVFRFHPSVQKSHSIVWNLNWPHRVCVRVHCGVLVPPQGLFCFTGSAHDLERVEAVWKMKWN